MKTPAMDVLELTLTILNYALIWLPWQRRHRKRKKNLPGHFYSSRSTSRPIPKRSHGFRSNHVRNSPDSEEALTPKRKKALQEVKVVKNQLAHMEAKAWYLCGACKELQWALRRIDKGKAMIKGMQKMLTKNKVTKRFISYDNLSANDKRGSNNSAKESCCCCYFWKMSCGSQISY